MSFWQENYAFIKDVYDMRHHKMAEWMDNVEKVVKGYNGKSPLLLRCTAIKREMTKDQNAMQCLFVGHLQDHG